jgi:SAM-dependent methyltransferase
VDLYRKAYGLDIEDELGGARTLELRACQECAVSYFDPMVAGSPRFYELLQRFDWYYTKTKPEFEVAAAHLNACHSILEVGCGEGYFAELMRGRDYVGLEYTGRSVQAARQRGIEVRQQTLEDFANERPASVDAVCAFQVLEHVTDPRSFISSALRCLKPGGRLVISVPCADSYVGVAVNNLLNFPPHHLTWWSDKALEMLGARFGLELEVLHHDTLADEHVESYVHTLFLRAFDRPGRAIGLIDTSMRSRTLHHLARLFVPVLARAMQYAALRPRGHSVTAVYRMTGATN